MTNAHDVPVLSTGDKNFEVTAELTENGVKSDSDKFLTVTVDDEDMLSTGIEAGGSISFRMTGGIIKAYRDEIGISLPLAVFNQSINQSFIPSPTHIQ